MTALLTVSALGLAGSEIARADVSSVPFPAAAQAGAVPVEGALLAAAAGPEGVPAAAATGSSGSSGESFAAPAAARPAVVVPPTPVRPVPRPPDPPRPNPVRPPAATQPPTTLPAPPPVTQLPPTQPPTTRPPASQPPTTLPAPPKPDGGPAAPKPAATTAAERLGWGTPLPGSDEFNYRGVPDPAKWNQAGECWAGHAGNGKRCASRSTVDGSKLVQTGLANGDSAWIASKVDQRYGRWEARVRSTGTGPANGRQYHPLLIVWPSSDRWPQDGEYDFLENGAPGQSCAESFIHYPHSPGPTQQVFTKEKDCGASMTEWHNVAFEWTPDRVRGFIDGRQWFDLSGGANGIRRNIQDMPSGHLTIQLDNFFGSGMQAATYEVDWVRIYGLKSGAR